MKTNINRALAAKNIIANNTVINSIMKKYIKYLCAVLMIMGTSAYAWGSVTYKVWNGSSYDNDGTVEVGGDLKAGTSACPITISIVGWCTTEVAGQKAQPTIYTSKCPSATDLYALYYAEGSTGNFYYTTKPNIYTITYDLTHLTNDDDYSYFCTSDLISLPTGATVEDGNVWAYFTADTGYDLSESDVTITYTSGGSTFTPEEFTLTNYGDGTYALYFEGVDGDITISAEARDCLPLEKATNLAVNKRYVSDAKTYVRFTWTLGSGTAEYADGQKFCFGPDGESGKCSTGGASITSAQDLRSKLSNGKYWWSVQALGSGDYCDGPEAQGEFCIDDVDQSTPSGLSASSITINSATLSWDAMDDAEGYAVTIKKKSDGTIVSGYDETTVEGTSLSITGLSSGTTYKVEIYAYNACADFSNTNDSYEFTTYTEYYITLDKNGGDEDGYAGVYGEATSLHELNAPTKTGYHVEGYYTTDGVATKVATDEGALQASITVSAVAWTNSSSQWVRGDDETFFAKWAANEYTVTLDPNGGSGDDQIVTATYGSAMPTTLSGGGDIVIPTKSGYEFAGYYYGETKYYDEDGNSATSWDRTSNTTLTAKWTTPSPTISIVAHSHVSISSTTPSIAAGSSSTYTSGNTVTLSHGDPSSGYYWLAWDVYETGNTSNKVTVTNNQFTMPTHNVTVTAKVYTSDMVFSCSELTLTAHPETAGAPIFITSTAEKKVRSQGYITITGSGLTPSTALTFPGLNSKFEVLTSTGDAISTDASGAINVNAYIFYTPGADETTDGLLKITGITVAVGGTKPKQKTITCDIIGRHMPIAGYVIAGKKDNKWYALPSNMLASDAAPAPAEIAVDNINNPSIAYTATSNIYGLEGPTTSGGGNNVASGNGQYVRLTMSIEDGSGSAGPAPLFGSSSTASIGKSGTSKATSNLSASYWWELKQTNTSITNPQDAKYRIKCANNSNTLSIKNNPFVWGLYASGVEELRLIPASDIPYTEAYFVEWGQYGGVIEVDATGIDATSVVAHLNGETSSAITLSQTRTASKNSASKYNYTVNFGSDINFAANEGQMLTLEWKKGETVKAVSNIVVPRIIATSNAMYTISTNDPGWNTEVHVLPGVTLTADAGNFPNNDVTIKTLEIYPGATVVVTKGSQASGTLNVTNLVLRNGWTRAGEKAYNAARLYITPSTANLVATNAYADLYIDYDQFYSLSVPFNVATNSITYRNTNTAANLGVRIRWYDGENRASTGQTQIGQNWKDYIWGDDMPTNLEPSKGYAISAKRPTGKAFSIVRLPLTIPSAAWTALGEQGEVSGTHKDQVSVTGWGKGTAEWYAMGWNFIGNPYMCTFNGDDDGIGGKLELQNGGSIKYATIPDVGFKNYDQVVIAEANLKPASGFFVQANDAEAQTITFKASKIVPPSAPAQYTNEPQSIPEQEAYIRLSYDGGKDQMGLIIGEDYTEAYEVNADLAKVLGESGYVKTYMRYGEMDMAYVAINQELAKEWIPVTVQLPTEADYTFSLTNSSEVEALEGVYLIDYANDGKITNLIEETYTFHSDAGVISNRFSINAIVGERETPTGIDAVVGGDIDSSKPIKFMYREKVFILYQGVIYDATGKKVKVINK